jgi:hypothetical protein
MSLALLMSFQAAAAPAPPPAAAQDVRAIDFDLARIRSADIQSIESLFACDRSQGADIVICGRRSGNAYPLAEMRGIFETGPLRAETHIGGATARAYVESVKFPNGMTSNRAMVGIKLPF